MANEMCPVRFVCRMRCATHLSDGYMQQRAVINFTGIYICGLFDTFKFSSSLFDIIVPLGVPDNSLAWQQAADEGFGASTLVLKGNFIEGFRTFETLVNGALGNNDCGVIIKLWRILLRLQKTGLQLGDFSMLKSFLQYLWSLPVIHYDENHPTTILLKILYQIPVNDLSATLEIGYLRNIRCLQSQLGLKNAVVLSTYSNYLKNCNCQALSTSELLSQYKDVFRRLRILLLVTEGTLSRSYMVTCIQFITTLETTP